MPNITKKPMRAELIAKLVRLASLPVDADSKQDDVLTRQQLAELVLYIENCHTIISQMKEKLYGEAADREETG